MNMHNVPVWYMEEVWERDDLNEWWLDITYDPNANKVSNVRIGDLFSLHKYNQFGMITRKTINVGANIESYFTYQIDGDIGGHWYHPRHEWLRSASFSNRPDDAEAVALAVAEYGCGYARFMPSATQLMEIANVIRDDWFGMTAAKLMSHYNRNPFASTRRGDLLREERARKEKDDGLEK